MSLLPFREKEPSSSIPDQVQKRIEALTSTPLRRSFLVEDVLVRRHGDQESSDLSFSLRRSDTSTGNFQVRENCQNLLRLRWENKGVQGILNLLGQTITLEEEISVNKEYEERLQFLSDENLKLRKEVSILRNRIQEYENSILT